MKKKTKPPLLKLSRVSKTYRPDSVRVKALIEATIEIKQGEFVAIMGPSGSGKSTLMHLAGCLDTPSTGKVILEGRDISQLSEGDLAKVRNKKIGFVFQSFNLIPRTTAQDNVGLPLLYSGVSHIDRQKKALQALEKVDLADRASHFPNQLSGGEQQRVAIARALVTSPSVIFADEPTGNLDTKTGNEIMKLFQKLNQEGKTIVFVTHENHIAKFAQRVIKIVDGQVTK